MRNSGDCMGKFEVCAENVGELREKLKRIGKRLVLKRVVVFGCGDKSLYVFEVVE